MSAFVSNLRRDSENSDGTMPLGRQIFTQRERVGHNARNARIVTFLDREVKGSMMMTTAEATDYLPRATALHDEMRLSQRNLSKEDNQNNEKQDPLPRPFTDTPPPSHVNVCNTTYTTVLHNYTPPHPPGFPLFRQ